MIISLILLVRKWVWWDKVAQQSNTTKFPTLAWSLASFPLLSVPTAGKVQIDIVFQCSPLGFNSAHTPWGLVGSQLRFSLDEWILSSTVVLSHLLLSSAATMPSIFGCLLSSNLIGRTGLFSKSSAPLKSAYFPVHCRDQDLMYPIEKQLVLWKQ